MTTGNTMAIFSPLDSQLIGSGNAALGNRNGHYTLEYPSGVSQSAAFCGVLPSQYANGGLTVYLHYTMLQSSGQNVLWGAQFASYGIEEGNNFINGYSPGQQNVVTSSTPGVLGQIKRDSIAFTDGNQIQNINGGDFFMLIVSRLGNSGSIDTGFGNAELLGIEVKET